MPIARKLPPLNIKNARNKQIESALKNASSTDHPHYHNDSSNHQWCLQGTSGVSSPSSGSLSPNLQPATPPTFTSSPAAFRPAKIGKYVLVEQTDRDTCACVDVHTQQHYVCKAVKGERHQEALAAHFRLDSIEQVNQIKEILVGETKTYIIYDHSFGDLHSYVRERRRLKESEALGLFAQIVTAVAACHEAGVVLRDLKLRRFVFKDPEKSCLMLETLDDAFLLEEDDDSLADKHGCPAYVSPEILTTSRSYSGKAADVWSLGVMLYTMLVGRYPFHDTEPASLFTKIRRGSYVIPDTISSKAKCLIRALLRMEPSERLTAEEALEHPWFRPDSRSSSLDTYTGNSSTNRSRCLPDRRHSEKLNRVHDQTVPEIDSYSVSSNKSNDDGGKGTTDTANVMSSASNDCPFMFP